MAHDVFISYSTPDKPVADTICATIEKAGVRCWYAPRDIQPGAKYGASIVDAISCARVLVVVVTADAILSPHVAKEVERAISKAVVVMPFRLQDVPLSKELEYFLSSQHWLDAVTPPLEKHVERLLDSIIALLSLPQPAEKPVSATERRQIARQFEEVAPDEWRRRPSGAVATFLRSLLAER